jgi:hypothetical protein
MALGDGFAQLEFDPGESAFDAPITRHGDIAKRFKQLTLDAGPLPGRYERAVPVFQGKHVLVDALDFDFKNFFNVLGVEGVSKRDETGLVVHPGFDVIAVDATGFKNSQMADVFPIKPLFFGFFQYQPHPQSTMDDGIPEFVDYRIAGMFRLIQKAHRLLSFQVTIKASAIHAFWPAWRMPGD